VDKVLYLFRTIIIDDELVISLLVIENNEFDKIGSFAKDSKTNIKKFYQLLDKNNPVLILNNYRHLKELYNASLEISMYNEVFSKINGNNVSSEDTNIFNLDNNLSNLKYKEEISLEDLEYNLVIDYLRYIEQMYLLDYYEPEIYKEKINILYYKLQDKQGVKDAIFKEIKKRM
jgi:hypothetical protein